MAIFDLDNSYANKTIKTNLIDLRFKYNTNQDYFYFDLYDLDGNIISYHNKVVTGFTFTGFIFTSSQSDSFANVENILNFKLVTDDG